MSYFPFSDLARMWAVFLNAPPDRQYVDPYTGAENPNWRIKPPNSVEIDGVPSLSPASPIPPTQFGEISDYDWEERMRLEGTKPPNTITTNSVAGPPGPESSALGDALSGAATGAVVGASAGPVGALVGAGVGALASLFD